MGRHKNFTREDVLEKAIPVFWKYGFADTKIEDLEEATGVNKSGLYSEFRSKDEIFVECLRHYTNLTNFDELHQHPLGWHNIRDFMRTPCTLGQENGCFAIFTIRELWVIPEEAQKLLTQCREKIVSGIRKNLEAESIEDADELASIVMAFFTGVALEQNIGRRKAAGLRSIDLFLKRVGFEDLKIES